MLIDGVSIGATGSYTFSDVTATHTSRPLSAHFRTTPSHVTQGANGTVAPGTTTVTSGRGQAFTITPNSGYQVASVTVDGSSLSAVTSYTFSNVTANQTITASFSAISQTQYTITPSAGSNGAISPSAAVKVNSGSTQTFTVTPSSGYTASVGGTCGGSLSGTTYTTNAIAANCTVTASFSQQTTQYTITPSAGSNGSISPSAAVQVNSGGTQTFTVTPSSGYTASVGGTCGGSLSGTTYTTNAIAANCTVTASFTQQQQVSGSLIQSGNVTYLGAFLVPSTGSYGVAETYYGGHAIGFNPNGNGGAGSLLIEGLSGQNTNGLYVAEISIPGSANLYTGSSTYRLHLFQHRRLRVAKQQQSVPLGHLSGQIY